MNHAAAKGNANLTTSAWKRCFPATLASTTHSPPALLFPSLRARARCLPSDMPPVTSELPVDGASVTTIDRFGDSRGYFNELYNETKYDESLQKDWKQVSFSSSQKHAMRGLHCSPHGKFITCVRGAFYDVIADFREDSPTFGRWCGVLLTEHNKKQVYVPANCGHGFFTIEDNTCALYLQEGCFNPVNEKDNHPLDPMFNVQWPVPKGVVPEMSAKDTAAPTLAVRRPHLTGMKPRGRVLIIGASGQVRAVPGTVDPPPRPRTKPARRQPRADP